MGKGEEMGDKMIITPPSLGIICYNIKQLSRPRGYVKAKTRLLPEVNKIKIIDVNNVVHETKLTTVDSIETNLVV